MIKNGRKLFSNSKSKQKKNRLEEQKTFETVENKKSDSGENAAAAVTAGGTGIKTDNLGKDLKPEAKDEKSGQTSRTVSSAKIQKTGSAADSLQSSGGKSDHGKSNQNQGSNSAPEKNGDEPLTLKEKIIAIITFSNISIVNVVHFGFLVLLVIICCIAGITFSSLSNLSNAFAVVSDKATPLAMTAKSLETDLLLIHNDVNQILMEKDSGRIPSQEADLKSKRDNFKTALEEFKNTAKDEPQLQEIISNVSDMTDTYISEISKIPVLKKELLDRTAEVNKQKASFAGLVRFFNNEENSFFSKIDDDFLLDSYRCMKAAQSTIESNTTTALDTAIPEKINRYIESNLNYLKEFNLNLNDLKREIKDLENNLGTYIASFVFDTTNQKGLIYNHLKLSEETLEMEKAANQATEKISKIRDYIKNIQELSNEAINQSNNTADQIFDRSRITLLIAVVISIIVAFFIAFLVGRSIRVPLSRIIKAISEMSEGVYTGRLDYRANNEFGRLTKRIKGLKIQFANVLRQVADGSNKVKNAAEANTESATNTANGIQSQQKMTNDVVSAIDEMRTSGSQMANSAQETRKIVLQAGDAVTTGSEVIIKNINTTRNLADRITSTETVINHVSDMSQNISSVIQVIRGVADQTNLLALNAAIEAARAGEHGRGFAVVADEVRTLASKTAASTNEIKNVIEALQTSVNQAVSSMHDCRAEMDSSIRQTTDVNEAIQRIQSHLNIITEYSDKIVEAASHQSDSTDAVAQNVHEIAVISENNVEEIKKVKEACLGLNELAKSQTEWVNKFTF